MSFINKITFALILIIRPLFGYAECRYIVTCTQFAAHELEKKSFIPALISITKRVLSCNPFF